MGGKISLPLQTAPTLGPISVDLAAAVVRDLLLDFRELLEDLSKVYAGLVDAGGDRHLCLRLARGRDRL